MISDPHAESSDEHFVLNEEEQHHQSGPIEKVHIIYKESFTNITTRFTSLWMISFAYCDPLPSIIPLSHFQALGFVDFSFTNVTFKTMQKALKRTHVLRLNCFGCKNIMSEGTSFNRGFLLFVVPNVWILVHSINSGRGLCMLGRTT